MARSRGLTLLELAATLVVAALLAGAVTAAIGNPRTAVLADVVLALRQADFELRRAARTRGTGGAMAIEREAGTLAWALDQDAVARGRECTGSFKLPRGFAWGRFWVEGARDESFATRVEIALSPGGTSASYAVEISGPESERKIVLLSGLTGEVSILEREDEESLRELFRTLGGAHPH